MGVDECVSPVRLHYSEYDHIGSIFHENSSGLSLSWGSSAKAHYVGREGDAQFCTKAGTNEISDPLFTYFVQRGEGEFPIDIQADGQSTDLTVEALQADTTRKAQARRQAGNEMYRASDFMQAAMEYTATIELDP